MRTSTKAINGTVLGVQHCFHNNSAVMHAVLSVQKFLTKIKTAGIPQLPEILKLSPADFLLLPKFRVIFTLQKESSVSPIKFCLTEWILDF
jgi:NADH:ubiquinone oxidoreductase subunit E